MNFDANPPVDGPCIFSDQKVSGRSDPRCHTKPSETREERATRLKDVFTRHRGNSRESWLAVADAAQPESVDAGKVREALDAAEDLAGEFDETSIRGEQAHQVVALLTKALEKETK